MAAARDSDIALWLHNKLGTSLDTWSEGSICSQLNIEVLRNIKECFVELQTQVKLKLLLSFFHLPKRNVDEWRTELEEIIEVAVVDGEPWVAMLAEIMKTYPNSGCLNLDIREPPENQRITHDLTMELRKLVKRHSELGLLPMECNYLNRNALICAAGHQASLTKHFALKRKPKAAALRAELLNRSADAQANVKKSQLPTVPVRSRGLPRKTDTTPMRGIPSRIPGSGSRSTGISSGTLARPIGRSGMARKDGGIKLVEITESPITTQQAKKRRRIQDANEAKAQEAEQKQKEQQLQQQQAAAEKIAQQQSANQQAPPTPDYAAGLAISNPPTPNPATPSTPTMPSTPSSINNNTVAMGTLVRTNLQGITHVAPNTPERGVTSSVSLPAGVTTQRILVAPGGQVGAGTPTVVYRTISHAPSYARAEVLGATPVAVTQTDVGQHVDQPQYATLQPVQPDLVYAGTALTTNLATAVVANPTNQHHQTQQPTQILVAQPVAQPQPPPPPAHVAPVANPQPVQKRGLSLTKEQMLEAQEMFKTSNKVTRPEKALILGFMAGSRDNPCPHLGNIVTIKLSEGKETVSQPDGNVVQMLAETHFQMNYNTGEWKRIKKYRTLAVE